jgi:hypothetical protein
MLVRGLDLNILEKTMLGSRGHVDKSRSIKGGQFLENLRGYQLF